MDHNKLRSNISKIYMLKFFAMFLVLMPIIVPFFQSVGIGMKGVYILQSVFGITVFLLEIPSGYVSDLLGRKNTLVVSLFLKGFGFSLFPLATDFTTLVIAEVILGFAIALSSGTDTALIYDTLAITDPKKAQIKVLGKSIAYLSFGEGLASLIASILMLYSISMGDLAIISAAMSWIPFFVALTIIEPPRKKMSQHHRENFKYIFRSLFKNSKLLNLVIVNSMFSFSGTLFAVWIFQKYWADLGIAISYFGFLWAITNFVVAITSKNAHRIEKRLGSKLTLIVVGLLPIAGYFGISLIDHIIGFLVCLLFQVSRGLGQVILKDALNKRVSGDFRATANSITQMGTRIFFSLAGPIFGLMIDNNGLSTSALWMGVFYLFVFIFIMLPLLRQRNNFISI